MFYGIGIVYFLLCLLVAGYANGKGKSGVGYFLISLILSPLLGFIIAALTGEEKKNDTVCKFQISSDSILLSTSYKEDSDNYGDWLVKQEADSKFYITVSTQRAYDFLLAQLEHDNKVSLRNRLIENRQGKTLN